MHLLNELKKKSKETLQFKLNQQMDVISNNPPKNLIEEGKKLLAVTFFETTNSVFKMSDGNISFSISTPSY